MLNVCITESQYISEDTLRYAAQFGIATIKVQLRLEIDDSSACGLRATAADSDALSDPIGYLGFEPPDRASTQWHRTRKRAGLDV